MPATHDAEIGSAIFDAQAGNWSAVGHALWRLVQHPSDVRYQCCANAAKMLIKAETAHGGLSVPSRAYAKLYQSGFFEKEMILDWLEVERRLAATAAPGVQNPLLKEAVLHYAVEDPDLVLYFVEQLVVLQDVARAKEVLNQAPALAADQTGAAAVYRRWSERLASL